LGDLKEFPLRYRLYLKTYRWQRIDPVPWSPLKKPLQDCRLALISSAGLVGADQEPFEKSIRIGDTGIRRDPNLAFPADRLREMADAGFIGSLNHRFFSLMGSVTAPDQLTRHTIPPIVSRLVEDQVDIALLIPV
jgi:D-proline reductase (dithiol) PrdB